MDFFGPSPKFTSYVDLARSSRQGSWWLFFGTVTTIASYLLFTIAIFFLINVAIGFAEAMSTAQDQFESNASQDSFNAFMQTPVGALTMIASLSGLGIGVALSLRFIHKRNFKSVLGSNRAIEWSDFRKAFLAFVGVYVVSVLALAPFDPDFRLTEAPLAMWIGYAMAAVGLIFLQTASEELFFRGYLVQGLAARFANPAVWVLLPVLLFAAGHYGLEVGIPLTIAYLLFIGFMGLSFTWLVIRTGNLGASIGAHFGNNIVALLLFSNTRDYKSLSLMAGQNIEDVGDDPWKIALVFVPTVLAFLTSLALLCWRRSPLVLDAFREQPA
jgi:uncharacterized protein